MLRNHGARWRRAPGLKISGLATRNYKRRSLRAIVSIRIIARLYYHRLYRLLIYGIAILIVVGQGTYSDCR